MGTMDSQSSKTPNELRLVSPAQKRHLDVLRVVLLQLGEDTLLPELYEIFGREALIKFLDIFAGTDVHVPGRELLENAVRDTDIYITIKSEDNPEITAQLARKYDVTPGTIRDIYQRMCNTVEGSKPPEIPPIDLKKTVVCSMGLQHA